MRILYFKKMIFTVVLIMQQISVPVFAADFFDGDMTYEEGAQVYVQTQEDLKTIQQKDRLLYLRSGGYPDYLTIPISVFEQLYSYYCGPATVKQVVHYINGTSLTQGSYAQQLGTTTSGTDMTLIPGVLNNNIGRTYYVYASIPTASNWFARIRLGIYNGMPTVLDINTNKVDEFPYNSSGHFINTSGYDELNSKIRITDPWGPGLGNKWYSQTSLYQANSDHFRKAMIY